MITKPLVSIVITDPGRPIPTLRERILALGGQKITKTLCVRIDALYKEALRQDDAEALTVLANVQEEIRQSRDATPKNGDLITCETIAAILVHVRHLGPSGPHYHGGADTKTLCGVAPAWDCKFKVVPENVTCRVCHEKIK